MTEKSETREEFIGNIVFIRYPSYVLIFVSIAEGAGRRTRAMNRNIRNPMRAMTRCLDQTMTTTMTL